MTEERVLELVREQLQKHRPGGVDLAIAPRPVRLENDCWYVPVLPTVEPPRMFEYYEALADVEATLEEEQGLQVLLVPITPEESAPATEDRAMVRAGGRERS
jgi:hypothetical protein